nr:tetraspanin [Hymenolepis microstoma]
MDCGGKFLKFLMIFFNTIVIIGGGIMAGYGIYLIVEAKAAGGAVPMFVPAFITTFGLLVFAIAFLGCFGACYNNSCMLKTFAIVIGILLVCEFIGGILLFVYRHNFVDAVAKGFQKTIKDYENNQLSADDPSFEALDRLQKELKCCGGAGPSDWNTPPSSCKSYKIGCAEAMYEEIKDSALTFGIIILILALIQIGAIICAACLAKKVNEYEKV